MKGIILAGGSGTRLFPATKTVCKQLLPVYDKPLIYYPLSTLMLADIKDILIISTPEDIDNFKNLFGTGEDFGIKLSYAVQDNPNGLAEAFIIGDKFIGNDTACLILGDNIFYGHGLEEMLINAKDEVSNSEGATVFGYFVKDPERYGVAEFNDAGKVISIEEKPEKAKSNYAVTGLYFYDNKVANIAKNLAPSPRGELEITDVNKKYLELNELKLKQLGRGFAWLDTGTHDSLLEAGEFISVIEKRTGRKIACIEEIAYEKGWIDKVQIAKLAEPLLKNEYGKYLMCLINE